jgi:hypothetical protein
MRHTEQTARMGLTVVADKQKYLTRVKEDLVGDALLLTDRIYADTQKRASA